MPNYELLKLYKKPAGLNYMFTESMAGGVDSESLGVFIIL